MNRHLYIFSVILLLCMPLVTLATHNRAGEITYRWIDGYTYEVTITTYTKISSSIDRCELTINWGDNTQSILRRVNGTSSTRCAGQAMDGENIDGSDVRKNVYTGTHTFPSPGYYTVFMQDLNRNSGVTNITNSVQVPFYISTTLLVNPAIGPNNSPQLLNPPIDLGCVQRLFIHNAGAFDPDGDSLSYELVYCKGLNGRDLRETYDPSLVKDSVRIDPVSGDFIWDLPRNMGQFNFAFIIKEYRRGLNGQYQLIGSVTRDMQIDIEQCNNRPPVIDPLGPFCVEAGQELSFDVFVSDPDLDSVTLSATGGPFELTPSPVFLNPFTGMVPYIQQFSWTPSCAQVRFFPYWVTFRAEDDPDSPPRLVDIGTVEIRVVAPAPKNPTATASPGVIDLNWDSSVCTQAEGYDIYRRKGSYGFIPSECETGVPGYTGYKQIGSTSGLNNTNFSDTQGLEIGVQYCYMVVARFADRSESYASEEFCAELPKTLPVITHVDVRNTHSSNGSIGIRWIPARDLDSSTFPPPYRYQLERAMGISGTLFSQIADLPDTDTSYTDSLLNTQSTGWNYRVRLLSGAAQNEVGTSNTASSIFATTSPQNEAVQIDFPSFTAWDNDTFVVYRETTPGSGVFDSIGIGFNETYTDTGLQNGQTYCYYGMGIGRFSGSNMPGPLHNRSQIVCGEPVDIEPPCPPAVAWTADCSDPYLRIDWDRPIGCPDDIAYYNIYYRSSPEEPWPSSPLVQGITDDFFVFDEGSIVGCYAVTAVDDAQNPNESELQEAFCIDGCAVLELPNAFSPDNDGQNDFFFPVRDEFGVPAFHDIEAFKIEIYNRWGRVVYDSEDAADFVNRGWGGDDRTTNLPCPEGVYFYICSYRAKSLGRAPETVLKGNIHLFR